MAIIQAKQLVSKEYMENNLHMRKQLYVPSAILNILNKLFNGKMHDRLIYALIIYFFELIDEVIEFMKLKPTIDSFLN